MVDSKNTHALGAIDDPRTLLEGLFEHSPVAFQASRMVFVTGGAFTPLAQAFLDDVPNEHLDKPFDAQHLRALVQRFVR